MSVDYQINDNYMLFFLITLEHTELRITISEPYMVELFEWEKLANGETFRLLFSNVNGGVSIMGDKDSITFNVEKMGSGGDGSISCRFKHELILPTLKRLIEDEKFISLFDGNYY